MSSAVAEEYIASLYATVLKRDPRPDEFAGWVKTATALPPEKVYFAFVNSKEYKLQQERSVPTMFLPGHYYSPVVDPSTVAEYAEQQYRQEPGDIKGIDFDEDAMVRLWKANAELIRNTPFSEHDDGRNRYYYDNGSYPYGDAMTLRAMIAHLRPRNIIEVGSGFSSACMLDAADHVGHRDFAMTCIDPDADRLRSRLRTEDHSRVSIIEGLVQDVPVSTFARLNENDILFIDSTHVLKTGSDVHYELFSILPSLNKGVVVHFHDIQYPFEYPRQWLFDDNRSWNEIYALRAYLTYNSAFEVVFWNGLFAHRQRELIQETNPLFLKNPGGSIWLRVRSEDTPQTPHRAVNSAAAEPTANLCPESDESASEAVRLLIWDLDDTYWRGTLTEGGITEYVRKHHDIVISLAQRGIMSSICSKNDEAKVMEILEREGIAHYFIFPSISWGPKAVRLASIIEAAQLRPATVMFIDDNHLNRAEAADLIPDLQIEDETFVARLLSDSRFTGRDDSSLTRLGHYKVLEQRKRDEITAEGNNEEFLRGCDMRVYIEYDVEGNIDRAVELINRTNQLNFTKVRLPEDPEEARAELSTLLHDPFRQSGLIRVVDKYGDYGFVGIYVVTSAAASGVVDPKNGRLVERLDHFCFSCRTLGMLVEAWVYDYLKRPHIQIVGEVLTDITIDRSIDWIRLDSVGDSGTQISSPQKVFPEIRVHGGCEANSVAHYLVPYADQTTVIGNFHAGNAFYRVNGSTLLLSACDRSESSLESEADALGIPTEMLAIDYFKNAPAGTAFVFGGQFDRDGSIRYRHSQYGWEICVEPHYLDGVDLVSTVKEDILARVAGLNYIDAVKGNIAKTALHIHDNYESVVFSQERDLRPAMEEIFSRVPLGSKLVLTTDDARVRDTNGQVTDAPWSAKYHAAITAIAAPYPFVRVVSFRDHIRDDEEINVGGNHYHRLVYLRMAEAIIEELKNIPPKTTEIQWTAEAASAVRNPTHE